MEALKHTIPRVLSELVRAAPLSPGKVECAWSLAVGPQLQRATTVRLVDRVLHVSVGSRAWADAVTRASAMILPRVQDVLGREAVARIEVRAK